MSRIVTTAYRPKRPRKRKPIALAVPAIVTKANCRAPADMPPVDDEQEPAAPPPANDDSPAPPEPPAAAKSAVVKAKRRGLAKLVRELPDDPEVDARVKAFFDRMIRPP